MKLKFKTQAFQTAAAQAVVDCSERSPLDNIQKVQRHQNLPISEALAKTKVSPLNLDIEMETGTGKTYWYIKTIFEMNKLYGWSKFIILVPSIAIRGDATGDVNEAALRRIQIREAIDARFDEERALFPQDVKVLSLFFIDEVAKYRDYAARAPDILGSGC